MTTLDKAVSTIANTFIRRAQTETAVEAVEHDLNALLIDLSRWGKVFLMQSNRGWRCSIEVNVNTTGVKFEVCSEGGAETPTVAALDAHERLRVALINIGGK